MFASTAYAAQSVTRTPGGTSGFLSLIFLFVIFYFLLIRPQQKRHKEHQATLTSLQIGDTVVTNGGIYGKILKIEGNVVTLDCSEKVRLKVMKKAISQKVDPSAMQGG